MNTSFKRQLVSALVALSLSGAGAQSVEVAGVPLAPTAQVGTALLQLNGAGLRAKVFFKVYVVGLYVPQKTKDAAELLAQKGARRLSLRMLRDVDAESFVQALADGLQENHTPEQLAALKPQMDQFIADLRAVGEVKTGDVIFFEYVPSLGTRISVNGQVRGRVIAGDDFFSAVLRIWLGDKPVDGSLKKALLGG